MTARALISNSKFANYSVHLSAFSLALVLDEFSGIAELVVPKAACIHFDGIKTKIAIIFQPFIYRFEM